MILENLHEAVVYDPETGIIRWRANNGKVRTGAVAGTIKKNGYIQIGINYKLYEAQRLAWFLHYGIWPKKKIDHINGIRTDNSISNLREATNCENSWNSKSNRRNTSGVKGLYFHRGDQLWVARVRYERKCFSKSSKFREVALVWLLAKREQLHGEFANHG